MHIHREFSTLFIGDFTDRVAESLRLFNRAFVIGFRDPKFKLKSFNSKGISFLLYPRYTLSFFPARIGLSVIYLLVLLLLLIVTSITKKISLINSGDALLSGLPSIVCAKILRRRVLIFIQGSSIDTLRSTTSLRNDSMFLRFIADLSIGIQRFVCRNADVVVSVSKSVARNITDKHGRPALIIPNGVDTEKFRPFSLKEIFSLRNILKVNDKFVILYAGRMSKEKGVHLLPSIILRAENKIPNIHLLVVGDGPLNKYIKNKFKKLNLLNYVSFLGTFKHEDMPKIINSADVLLLPSLTEGLPLIIQEAFACEKPVVATNVGGVSEIVKHKENGLLVESGDIGGIVDSLYFLYKNPDLRMKYGRNGRMLVESSFSREVCRRKFISAYKLALH